MRELRDAVVGVLERTPELSGVVRIDRHGETLVAEARGFRDRANEVANTLDTRFPVASITKSFTGLAVCSLIVDGVLALDTTARSLLGDDLPLVDDAVTVGQLLTHTSGIGDYLDEEQLEGMNDYVMTTVPLHQLDSAEAYVAQLDGFPQVSAPGSVFLYNNGGFVVLALLAERAAGRPYHDLVRERVIEPAGLTATGFERADERPADVALGYLFDEGLRTNVLHMPLRGVGDGGITTTVDDLHRLWAALRDGRVLPPEWADRATGPMAVSDDGDDAYGYGFWVVPTSGEAQMIGSDAGIAAMSADEPRTGLRWSILTNQTDGAWKINRPLRAAIVETLSP